MRFKVRFQMGHVILGGKAERAQLNSGCLRRDTRPEARWPQIYERGQVKYSFSSDCSRHVPVEGKKKRVKQ